MEENAIKILRSNHFVQEYLEQNGVSPEIRRNPRFQSIIWHISVMLNRQKIDINKEKVSKWMQENIKIGTQGDIMYALSKEDAYYLNNASPVSSIQFVKYFSNKGNVQREVKEINKEGRETLHILSYYNQDGIEEKQLVDDKGSNFYIIERIKNRPELRAMIEYDKEQKEIMNIYYQERTFWVALEDLTPNIVEIDPIETNPILKYGALDLYQDILYLNKDKIKKAAKNRILPLPEKDREEQLQYYKDLNENYHRTKIFESGIAKLLCVRNRENNK